MTPKLPSVTVDLLKEQENFATFRRALRSSDQTILDRLFASVKPYLYAASYADKQLPIELMMLCMLLEQHKAVGRLRERIEEYLAARGVPEDEE